MGKNGTGFGNCSRSRLFKPLGSKGNQFSWFSPDPWQSNRDWILLPFFLLLEFKRRLRLRSAPKAKSLGPKETVMKSSESSRRRRTRTQPSCRTCRVRVRNSVTDPRSTGVSHASARSFPGLVDYGCDASPLLPCFQTRDARKALRSRRPLGCLPAGFAPMGLSVAQSRGGFSVLRLKMTPAW